MVNICKIHNSRQSSGAGFNQKQVKRDEIPSETLITRFKIVPLNKQRDY